MQLEEYFDFLAPDDIRLRGHRIGIESILDEYVQSRTPEEILREYPTLSLEEIHATILLYLHNKEKLDAYLKAWRDHGAQMLAEQRRNPSPIVAKLLELQKQGIGSTSAGE